MLPQVVNDYKQDNHKIQVIIDKPIVSGLKYRFKVKKESGGKNSLSQLPNDEGVKEDEESQDANDYPKVFTTSGRVAVNFGLGKLAYIYSDSGLGKTVREIMHKQEH